MRATLSLALLIASSSLAAPKQGEIDPRCEKWLPAKTASALLEREVTLMPYDPMAGAGGHCNYAADGKVVLLFNHEANVTPERFQKFKGASMYSKDQKPVEGVKDEAFSCRGMAGNNIVLARKEKAMVIVSSFMGEKGKSLFDVPTLAAVARKVLE